MLNNLYYVGLTVGVAAGLFVALVGIGVKTAPQVDSKGWSEVSRGCCVLVGQGGAATAALIVLMHVTPQDYITLIGLYGPPFSWGLYVATAIILVSPLVTAAALWYVRKTSQFSWMPASKNDVSHHLRRR